MISALRLLWSLGVRHLASHRARVALSAFGIAAGVSLAVAVSALGSSIEASLKAVTSAVASRANVEVRANGGTGMPPDVLATVRAVEGVEAAGATVESYTRVRRGERTERVLMVGADRGIAGLAEGGEQLGAAGLGLSLPPPVARDLSVSAGDRVEITTPDGWKPVVVAGVLPDELAGRTRVAAGPIGVIQDLLGRGRRLDAVYVAADEPLDVIPRLRAAVGDTARVGPVAFQSDRVRQLMEGTTSAFDAAVVVALFVGAFLVYNTMSMAAVERVQEAALMRAIGARRRQVFGLFVAEGALLGVIGSLAGLGGGIVLARLLLAQRGGPLEDVYPIEITTLALSTPRLVAAGVAGVLAALAAAVLPARRVSRADPAPALGPVGALEDPTTRALVAAQVIGVLCIVAGVPVTLRGFHASLGSPALALTGFVLVLTGVALLIRTVVPFVARVVLSPLKSAPGLVRLATGEVLRAPGRTAFTAGAVLLALSLVVAFTLLQASFMRTFQVRFDEIIQADLYVRAATWRPLGSDVPVDAALASELKKVEGVQVAYPFRVVTSDVDGDVVIVLTYDFDAYASLPGLTPEVRRQALGYASLIDGPGRVLVSPSVTSQLGIDVGEKLPLSTPSGVEQFTVAGVIDDPSAVTPEVFVPFDAFSRLWLSHGADSFPVGLSPGADTQDVISRIEARFGPTHGLQVDTRAEYADRLNSLVRGTLRLLSSVQLVAVAVAAMGLANTLLISTLERRRDLGVLRAVGMRRGQVRRMVVTEAVLIGILGVGGAWVLGTIVGLGMRGLTEAELGTSLALVWPWWGYAAAGALGVGASAVAALYPAHRAATVDVVRALQYE